MPLVYALVARAADAVVLAQHAVVNGNFQAVALECLDRARSGGEERFSITCDGYTFNYLINSGYVFVVAADDAYGRQIPFACCKRIADAWTERFWEKGRTAAPNSMERTFGPVLRREMEYCQSHPEEMSRMAAVQQKVDEVKGIMVQNVESVLQRGENLDVLVNRTDDLRDQAHKFQIQGTQLRKRMCWQNVRMKLCVLGSVAILVLVIFLAACFGGSQRCFGNKDGGAGNNQVAAASPPALPDASTGASGAPGAGAAGAAPADTSGTGAAAAPAPAPAPDSTAATSQPTTDGTTAPTDTSAPSTDAAPAPSDATSAPAPAPATSATDFGTATPDAAAAPPDATTAPTDAGTAPTGTAANPSDTGAAPTDTGAAPTAAGAAPTDATTASPTDNTTASPTATTTAPTDANTQTTGAGAAAPAG